MPEQVSYTIYIVCCIETATPFRVVEILTFFNGRFIWMCPSLSAECVCCSSVVYISLLIVVSIDGALWALPPSMARQFWNVFRLPPSEPCSYSLSVSIARFMVTFCWFPSLLFGFYIRFISGQTTADVHDTYVTTKNGATIARLQYTEQHRKKHKNAVRYAS